MPQADYPDLFENERQGDLFGAEPIPAYRPDPDKVRARLYKILGGGPGGGYASLGPCAAFPLSYHRPSDDRLSP